MRRRQDVPELLGQRCCISGLNFDLPAWRVALKIFTLPFKHTRADLCGGGVVLAGVFYILEMTQRKLGINKMRVVSNEAVPLQVSWNRDGSSPQLLHSIVSFIGIPLQDASQSIVSLLDLPNDD